MGVKKTIAIVGATEKAGSEIAKRFSFIPYRLLLIDNDAEQLSQLSSEISGQHPIAEFDSVECVKDGCWEADIIILAVAASEEKPAAEKMKEVATQKIVVEILNQELEQLLPFSKIVKVTGIPGNEIVICGKDEAVNEEIAEIFKQAGYQVAQIYKA